jgi:hypothetical protein
MVALAPGISEAGSGGDAVAAQRAVAILLSDGTACRAWSRVTAAGRSRALADRRAVRYVVTDQTLIVNADRIVGTREEHIVSADLMMPFSSV